MKTMKNILIACLLIWSACVNGQNFIGVGSGGPATVVNSVTQSGDTLLFKTVNSTVKVTDQTFPYNGMKYFRGKVDTTVYFTGALLAGPSTTNTMSKDYWRAFPIYCPANITVNEVAIYVTTAQTNAHIVVGIYADNGSIYPGSLVKSFGVFDAATIGVKESRIGYNLQKNKIYWLVFNTDVASVVVRALPTYSVPNILGYNATMDYPYTAIQIAGNYSATLPTTYPASAALVTPFGVMSPVVRMQCTQYTAQTFGGSSFMETIAYLDIINYSKEITY